MGYLKYLEGCFKRTLSIYARVHPNQVGLVAEQLVYIYSFPLRPFIDMPGSSVAHHYYTVSLTADRLFTVHSRYPQLECPSQPIRVGGRATSIL